MKKVKSLRLKIFLFTAVKNRCMLHGRVFVMSHMHHSKHDRTVVMLFAIKTQNECYVLSPIIHCISLQTRCESAWEPEQCCYGMQLAPTML